MSRVYISNGKRFIWNVHVIPHLMDKEDVCPDCGGNPNDPFRGMLSWDEEDKTCKKCNGTGKRTWYGPLNLDDEVQSFLQKCLDKYIEDKIQRMESNPPFLGMGI